jgi:hypothetical protein
MALVPFNVPYNIPKGTAVADSFRIAPNLNLGTTVNAAGQLISNSGYNNYGPGMLMTPIATWNIVPYATVAANIVAIVSGPTTGWLALNGDNLGATLTPNIGEVVFPSGAPATAYLQFDWPRVPSVTIDTDQTAIRNVTFFGYDWYGFPLQHTYQIRFIGKYPGPISNTAGTSGVPVNGKAFYIITGVYVNGTITGNLSCESTNTFGLPYVLNGYDDVTAFTWNDKDMRTQGGSGILGTGANLTIRTPAVTAILTSINAGTQGGSAPQLTLSTLTSTAVADIGTLYVTAPPTANSPAQGIGSFIIQSTDTGDVSNVTWSIPNGGQYIIAPADMTSPSTALSGDVRGLFQLPNNAPVVETWAQPPSNTTGAAGFGAQAIFSYYCEGFDQWLNILSAGYQPQPNGIQPTPVPAFPKPGANPYVPPNTIVQIYGQPQYYTGVPA